MTRFSIGPYQVSAEIGRGGAGTVYKAAGAAGVVAVKVLTRPTPEGLARFERERRLLDQLGRDAGFVSLVDSGQSPAGPYLVMPFVEGGSLRARLENGKLGVEETVRLAGLLARAMGRAHAQGLVHRDLKPENILFDKAGTPLIADLGLAKHFTTDVPGASQSIALTKTGEFRGTAGYMPPEQIDGSKELGPAADVFSLGAVIYECLTGEATFQGDSIHEVLARVTSGNFTPTRQLSPETPPWLAAIVERALAPDWRARPADGNALADALAAGPTAYAAARRRRLALGLVAVSVASAAGAGLFFAPRGSAQPVAPPPVEPPPPTRKPEPPPRPANAPPEWYEKLARDERPSFLPKGLKFGTTPGEYLVEKDGSVLVFVPRGTFTMGTPDHREDEKPPHEVELSAYFIGKYEVTVAQFARFVEATGWVTLAEKDGHGSVLDPVRADQDTGTELAGTSWRKPHRDLAASRPDHPVVQVSWEDARRYAEWAGLGLPTEAQWERAAGWDRKTGQALLYPWGGQHLVAGSKRQANVCDVSRLAVFPSAHAFEGYDDGFAGTAPVGSFKDSPSPVGALDMGGNVEEWCLDAHDHEFYKRSPRKDPFRDPAGAQTRVVRGGSFASTPSSTRCGHRDDFAPFHRSEHLGFRVALR